MISWKHSLERLEKEPFSFVGRPVTDEYGRQIGRIASFMVSPNGRVNGVFIKHENGKFHRYSSNQFKTKGDDVIFSSVKAKAEALYKETPLILRKDQALSRLLEKKKISQEAFNKFHKNFDTALNQMKVDVHSTLENIDKQIVRCNQQIKELPLAMVYLMLEHAIGKIDEKRCQTAMKKMKETLEKVNAEKVDLEATRNKLSNMLGEEATAGLQAETKKEAVPAPPALPEPPVEVRIKS